MLFRDGFRIHPYGNEDDDWLDFDRTAFSRTSYKLNRAQFIGKIDIGRGQNPYLIDQANREGLKDTPEKEVLISFVRNLVQDEVWAIMAGWEKAQKKADPASVLKNKQKRMKKQVADIKKLLDQLASNDGGPPDPDHAERAAAAQSVREFLDNTVESTISEASRFVAEAQDERAVVMHLAGIGLMLEVVAHELKRATTAALASVTKLLRRTSQDDGIRQPLRTLQAQLKNLEKRVRILDPHSTAGRNRKEQFDIIDWTRAVLDTHQAQVEAMGGSYSCEVASGSTDRWTVEMVKGIYLQIVENLINNSVHWLAIRKSRDAGFVPRITVIFDSTKKTVAVSDNGPGIPFEQGERVFEPFVTKRPPGESRGLGLYIARENAKYVGLRIALSETPVIHEGYYNTFIISWGDEA